MPTINQLPVLSAISSGDQLPVYSPNNGDARRTSIGSLLTFFQQSFASPTMAVNLYVPGSGFNITVPTPVSNDQWMLLQPAGTLATGTITLPLNTGVPDGTTVLITTTQEITSLTIALNGASAIFGGVSFLAAESATAIRFYQPTNSWYQINAETLYAAGMQAFLAVPSSANLRAAMTDETGTGLLVFNTSPTLVTPILGTPTSGTVTNLTGTASININGTVGATTPASGAFTTVSATGVATFAAGIVALPSITTTGNTNTGVYFPAADTVGITVGGTQRGSFSSTGLAVTGALSTTGVVSVAGAADVLSLSAPTASSGRNNITLRAKDSGGTATSVYFGQNIYNTDASLEIFGAAATHIGIAGNPNIANVTGTGLAVTGTLTSTGKQGYATGAGGTVTQATSKATGVTLSKSTGQITLNAAALAASTTVSFTLTNTVIEAGDILILNHISAGTAGSYLINAQSAAGSASINVRNISLGSLSEAIVIAFAVIKAVTA